MPFTQSLPMVTSCRTVLPYHSSNINNDTINLFYHYFHSFIYIHLCVFIFSFMQLFHMYIVPQIHNQCQDTMDFHHKEIHGVALSQACTLSSVPLHPTVLIPMEQYIFIRKYIQYMKGKHDVSQSNTSLQNGCKKKPKHKE